MIGSRPHQQHGAHYKVVLDLEADHHWAFINLRNVLRFRRPNEEAVSRLIRLADFRPDRILDQVTIASLLIEVWGRLEEAQPILNRVRQIVLGNPNPHQSHEAMRADAWLDWFGITEKWLGGDLEGAWLKAEQARQSIIRSHREGLDVSRRASFLGAMYVTLGQLTKAVELHSRFDARAVHLPEILAWLSVDLEHRPVMESHHSLVFGLGRIEQLEPASMERLATNLDPKVRGWAVKLALGGAALGRGRFSEAVSLLKEGLNRVQGEEVWPTDYVFSGTLALVEALVGEGNLSEAIRVLERLSEMRRRVSPASTVLWLKGRARLARLYRRVGREHEARQLEDELRRLLIYAEETHPILRQLNDAKDVAARRFD